MNHLIQGGESAERIGLPLKLTKIESEPIRDALFDYYVTGVSSGNAAAINDVKHGNVRRGMEALEDRAAIVEAIKEADWGRHLAKLAAANAMTCGEGGVKKKREKSINCAWGGEITIDEAIPRLR